MPSVKMLEFGNDRCLGCMDVVNVLLLLLRCVKTGTVRNALRMRYGAFWNAKLAVRFQKPYLGKPSDGKCPLCKQPDSGTHTLEACTHRHMKGLYIERHSSRCAKRSLFYFIC